MMAKDISQVEVRTREQMKKQRSAEKVQHKSTAKKNKRVRVRLIPIWLRIVLLLIFLAASLAAGLMVGYGVIGDGNPTDALKKETWTHIIDLVIKEK
ncbi:DNA-directed RNA polymerase subunit beta [Lederbergia graminis]|uniref:DNA-directed RNA polymerase subunit beta n=1 Tax=Lederbergia graminis TaxID=735518 RepID=A0ABW0LN56_9BACI|nr:DNA-directed RNA polymerase subunit beta [Paenibacillus bovis]